MAPYFQGLQGLAGEFGVSDACVPAGVARHLRPEGQAATFLTEQGHMPLGEPEKRPGLAVAFEKSICRNGIVYGLCLIVCLALSMWFATWAWG